MNSVFNRKTIRSLKKLSAFLLFTIAAVMSATAEECGQINFQPVEYDGKKYSALITSHNGYTFVNAPSSRFPIAKGVKMYEFSPGKHMFDIVFISSSLLKVWSPRLNEQIREAKREMIQIDIRANTFYQFNIVNEQGEFTLAMTSSERPCVPTADVYKAQNKGQPIENIAAPLPAELEYRLHNLMTKIAKTQLNENPSSAIANVLSVKGLNTFGLVVDNQLVNNGRALKVLSVLPFSQASEFTLRSGDHITQLGDLTVADEQGSPSDIMQQFLASLTIGKTVKITLNRQGNEIELSPSFNPVLVPEASYQLARETTNLSQTPQWFKSQPLVNELTYEYNLLMLELYHYIANKVTDVKTITIEMPAKLDHRFGISGDLAEIKSSTGLKVINVKANSIAEHIGLKPNDVVIKINNEPFTQDNAKGLQQVLTSLSAGESYSITLYRNGEPLTLTQDYNPQALIAFTLNINLASKVNAENYLVDKIKNMRKGHHRDKLFEARGHTMWRQDIQSTYQ